MNIWMSGIFFPAWSLHIFYEQIQKRLLQEGEKVDKLITKKDLMKRFKSKTTIMVGGFLGVGTPETVIDCLLESKVDDLTLICNDTAFVDKGVGKLVVNKRLAKAIVSHIGTNPETGKQMNSGELAVELVPQGTLAERIRAGGAGLGGILTPTGIGTLVENGKKKIQVNNKEYLVEKALHADLALIKAYKTDEAGNLIFRATARNFNTIMATAADYVIAEVEEKVPVGAIDANEVMLPGIFVDAILKVGE